MSPMNNQTVADSTTSDNDQIQQMEEQTPRRNIDVPGFYAENNQDIVLMKQEYLEKAKLIEKKTGWVMVESRFDGQLRRSEQMLTQVFGETDSEMQARMS